MREIKFDAIYKPTGEHFTPINTNFNDNTVSGNFYKKENNWCHFSLDGEYGDVILRQYTGLKDKNEKEIYEGDALNIKEKGQWGGEYNASVKWVEWDDKNVVGGGKGEHWAFYGIVCLSVKEISHHQKVNTLFTRGFVTRQFGSCIQLTEMTKDVDRFEIKIIGNIYENPELLGGD